MTHRHLRVVAVPPPIPCTCGGSSICTACVLADLELEAALMTLALERTERSCGLEGAKQ